MQCEGGEQRRGLDSLGNPLYSGKPDIVRHEVTKGEKTPASVEALFLMMILRQGKTGS